MMLPNCPEDSRLATLARMPPRSKSPPLTPEQRRLVADHLQLVVDVAWHVRPKVPQTIGIDDLLSFGYEGLIDAAQRFTPARGATFKNFAYARVKGEMFDQVRKVGPYKQGDVERYKAYEDLSDRRERGDVSTKTFQQLALRLQEARPVRVVKIENAADVAAAGPSPETSVHAVRLREKIQEAVADLRTKEREVLRLYSEDKNLEEAGEQLGMTKSGASRLLARSLKLLKMVLDGKIER